MTGERYYYHSDHQGSITHLTNEDGNIVETFTYDHAYGTILEHNKEEETYNPYCYTAREFDSHDLYYYRARYYNPTIGRFISNDPIEFLAGDFNFYRYVGNDPVNFVDPSGLYASDSDPAYMRVALGSKPKTTTTPTDQRLIAAGVPAACAGDVTGHNIDNKETDEMFENISMFFGVAGILKGLASFFGKKAIQTCAKEAPKTTGSGGVKVVEGAGDVGKASKKKDPYAPKQKLPKDKHGHKIPDSDLPHTQLGTQKGRNGDYTQSREWGAKNDRGYDGKTPKKDIDWTDHGRKNHTNPHEHSYNPNTGKRN